MSSDLRLIVIGGPKTGKTTLTERIKKARPDLPIFHTDDIISDDWSAASATVSDWMSEPGPWVIEGVTTARGLRKWIRRNYQKSMSHFKILLMDRPMIGRTQGQETMAKGVVSVWRNIMAYSKSMGAEVVTDHENLDELLS